MKSVVLIKDLLIISPYTKIKDIHVSVLYCNCRSLILTDVNGGCVHYARSFAIAQAQIGPKLVSVIPNSGVSAVEGGWMY